MVGMVLPLPSELSLEHLQMQHDLVKDPTLLEGNSQTVMKKCLNAAPQVRLNASYNALQSTCKHKKCQARRH